MAAMEVLYLAERKKMIDWVAEHYEELSGMYQDPWLRQLMEEVMHSACIERSRGITNDDRGWQRATP